MTQRREFDRVSVPLPIRFRILGGFSGMWLDGMMLDLSAGGMRFASLHPVDQGANLEFHLTLPDRAEPYTLSGQVLWVDTSKAEETNYGAVFTNVTEQQQGLLDDLVQFLKRGHRAG